MKYNLKVTPVTEEALQRTKEININKARVMFQSFPIATKVWLAGRLKMPIDFIIDNWKEITR